MNDCEALLRSVLIDPDDDMPRKVYADWLEKQGEPERAEFIRVQCEIARKEPPKPQILEARNTMPAF